MTGCSAPFCTNSFAKGYAMKVFPRDPERRAQWAKNVGRLDWTPTDRSYLCEVHFAPNMWETKRADNKQKLKPNAVPTIFGYYLKNKPFEEIQNKNFFQTTMETEEFKIKESLEDDYENEERIDEEELYVDINVMPPDSPTSSTSSITDLNSSLPQIDDSRSSNCSQKCDCEKYKERANKLISNIWKLRRKLKARSNELYRIRNNIKELRGDNYKKAFQKIFNEDQIRSIFSKRQSVRNWSDDTIAKAQRLKAACGTQGYQELLLQNIPLPSLRTLRRKLETPKSISDNSEESYEYIKLESLDPKYF